MKYPDHTISPKFVFIWDPGTVKSIQFFSKNEYTNIVYITVGKSIFRTFKNKCYPKDHEGM